MKGKKIGTFAGSVLSFCMIFGFVSAPALQMNVFADDITIVVDDSKPQIENTDENYDEDIFINVDDETNNSLITEDENIQTEAENAEQDTEGSTSENDEDPALYSDGIAGQFNEDNREVTNPARNVRLKVPTKNDLVIGDTFQIVYAFSPLKSDDYVIFKSFDKKIVQVDENGLVTAVGFGTTRVRLESSKGIKKNVYFTVTDREGGEELIEGEAEEIGFAEQSAVIRKGKQYQIEPIIYPLGIVDELTYSSDNKNIATVTKDGLVKAVGTGTTTIIVSASNGISGEFTVTVYMDVLKGIDVSKWQGDIDWKTVSKSGIDYVMIRSSFGKEDTDICLKKNVAGCEKYGIEYGFYHYTYARTVSEAKKEAKYFLKKIKNYDPTYPIVLDIEESFYKQMSRKQVTDIIVAFMSTLEDAGYYASIYSYATFFNDYVDMPRVERYDIWIASWGDEEKLHNVYNYHYGMWQYSCKGSIDGIEGDVDLNYAFKDYSDIIKRNGLNGQEKPPEEDEDEK